jgi:hypothetical protein
LVEEHHGDEIAAELLGLADPVGGQEAGHRPRC